ncbi:MAG: hypothetical protein V3R41_00410 [Gammaproteobacteria bacterium]
MSRTIKMDKYGNAMLSIKDGKKALLHGMDIDFAIFEESKEVDLFNRNSEQILGRKTSIRSPLAEDIDLQVYHDACAADWNIPESYKNTDVKEFLLLLCDTTVEKERVEMEYAMFEERKLIPLLQFLFFIVDYMRKYKIVWGVGRGSSVASYCLYLMGVHKINSLEYELDIKEFLK